MLTDTQTAQNVPPLLAPSISVRLSTPELQKQEAPVLQQPSHQQAAVEAEPYPESAAQWLAEVLNLLTDIVDRNTDMDCAIVTENDYKQLSEILADLIYGVGEDESHPLASLMAFIGGLIQRYEDGHFPKLEDLFPELKENPSIEVHPPSTESPNVIPVWTETEVAIHAFFSIGNILSAGGWIREAVSAYDMVIRLKPDYAEVYYNRGTAKTLIGEYKAAITDFDEAIHLNPEFVEAHYNRGLTKVSVSQIEGARYDLEIALKLVEQQGCNNIKINIQQRLEELNNPQ